MSGAKLDYRRYSDVLFDILFAGGQLGKKLNISQKHAIVQILQLQKKTEKL